MLKAEGVSAYFSATDKSGNIYEFSRPVEFWFAREDHVPEGMLLDDNGGLYSAESRTNFVRYHKTDVSPVVAALPGNGTYAVYREPDGELFHAQLAAILIHEDGTLTVGELSSEGYGLMRPDENENFVGIWHESWGDEPSEWAEAPKPRARQVGIFEATS